MAKKQTTLWTCDEPGCDAGAIKDFLPSGWLLKQVEVGPCGLTDYFRMEDRHFCPLHVRAGEAP